MDRKSIFILIACFLLLMLWGPLVNLMLPPKPVPRGTNALGGAVSPAGQRTNVPQPAVESEAPARISLPSTPALPWVRPQTAEELRVLENAHARYTITSHGGGLKLVELKEYPELVARRSQARTNRFATLNRQAPIPAMALAGGSALDDDAPFRLTQSEGVVRAEKELTNGLRIVKEFGFGSNQLLAVTLRLSNQTQQPLALPAQELVVGAATPINILDNGQFLGVQSYDGGRAEFINQGWFANRTLGCLPGTPRDQYLSPQGSNVVWAAVHNQFFTLAIVPHEAAPQLRARQMDLPPPTASDLAAYEKAVAGKAVAKPFGFQSSLVYPARVLAPGQAWERHFDLYAGPKEYNRLARLGHDLDLAMNFTTFFGWFAKALLLSMNGLHGLGLSYGLTIIAITVIIKLLFWPLTQASTRSMKRMQALQPQMKALQEKYKDDPKKMNLKLMEFMKENKVNPMGGCFPILLQIPVFIGFYQMLQSAIELRGASFLWAFDLSQPDTVAQLAGFPVNPLPLIMGVTQFWQARLTPPSPGVDPVQQKMMQYMPLIFIFILYSFPAGLALYWTVQNLLSILQMKLTKVGVLGGPGPATPKPGLAPGKKR